MRSDGAEDDGVSALLTHPGLILKPDFRWSAESRVVKSLIQRRAKVFFKSPSVAGSFLGWRGVEAVGSVPACAAICRSHAAEPVRPNGVQPRRANRCSPNVLRHGPAGAEPATVISRNACNLRRGQFGRGASHIVRHRPPHAKLIVAVNSVTQYQPIHPRLPGGILAAAAIMHHGTHQKPPAQCRIPTFGH